MEFVLIFGLSTIYILGALTGVRVMHVRRYTSYLRWKADKPQETTATYDNIYNISCKRVEFTYGQYIRRIASELDSPGWAVIWPLFLPFLAAKRFCLPEVKIPDITKVNELERLMRES